MLCQCFSFESVVLVGCAKANKRASAAKQREQNKKDRRNSALSAKRKKQANTKRHNACRADDEDLGGPLFRAGSANNEVLASLECFEESAEAATILYHLNSGHEKFPELQRLMHKAAGLGAHDVSLTTLARQELIRQLLTDAELDSLVSDFCNHVGRPIKEVTNAMEGLEPSVGALHIVCGSCGMRIRFKLQRTRPDQGRMVS